MMIWVLIRAARVSFCRRDMSRRRARRAHAVIRSCVRPTARFCNRARRRGAIMQRRRLAPFRIRSVVLMVLVLSRLLLLLRRARPRARPTLPPSLPYLLRRGWHNPTWGPARVPLAAPLQLGSRRRPVQGPRRGVRGFGPSCADELLVNHCLLVSAGFGIVLSCASAVGLLVRLVGLL